jgi:hypothetical protein
MGGGDGHWNELADGRIECKTAVNCDDLTKLPPGEGVVVD